MTLTVRPATIDDARPIARVHLTAWQVAYEGLIPQDYLDALELAERTELWRSILSGEMIVPGVPRPVDIVATLDETVVGFANVGRFRDQPENETAGELWAMYVEPDFWGAGVGDALMTATTNELDRIGAEQSFLWVLDGNARARRFYERHRWTSDELTKSFSANDVEIPELRYSRRGAPA